MLYRRCPALAEEQFPALYRSVTWWSDPALQHRSFLWINYKKKEIKDFFPGLAGSTALARRALQATAIL